MSNDSFQKIRNRVVELLLVSAERLNVSPIVKYSALSLFADRFWFALSDSRQESGRHVNNWMLRPLTESSLQLFGLISLWISSKIHDSQPLSVKRLKALGDKVINDQHFTTRDYIEAEVVFMQVMVNADTPQMMVLKFEISVMNTPFAHLEDLHRQFIEIAKIGDVVNLKACMNILDLLYETEINVTIYNNPLILAASILIASYLITVPKQIHEFPLLPWVAFSASFKEDEVLKLVEDILKHVLYPLDEIRSLTLSVSHS